MEINQMVIRSIGIGAMLLAIVSCNQNPDPTAKYKTNETTYMGESSDTGLHSEADKISHAVCVLHPTEGNVVKGTVWFTEEDGKISIKAELEGLTEGKHGFHIHEYGDCTAADGTSAGGHFNPEGVDHSAHGDAIRHVGDMGNITVGSDGKASLSVRDDKMSFRGKNSIIGRSIIVHAGEDDLKSQPTGDAGGRVACGVIGIAK